MDTLDPELYSIFFPNIVQEFITLKKKKNFMKVPVTSHRNVKSIAFMCYELQKGKAQLH